MDGDIKEKIVLLDGQIEEQKKILQILISREKYIKYDPYSLPPKRLWDESTIDREEEILRRIDDIQDAKTRLITGEKLPEVIYVDKKVPKYITKKEVHVFKSGLASSFAGVSIAIYVSLAIAYAFGVFGVVIN